MTNEVYERVGPYALPDACCEQLASSLQHSRLPSDNTENELPSSSRFA